MIELLILLLGISLGYIVAYKVPHPYAYEIQHPMRKLNPAISDFQVSLMSSPNFDQLASVRKNLIQAIREVLVEGGAKQDYINKFDKTFEINNKD